MEREPRSFEQLYDAHEAAELTRNHWMVNEDEFRLLVEHGSPLNRIRLNYDVLKNVSVSQRSLNDAHITNLEISESAFRYCRFINTQMWYNTFTDVDFKGSDFTHTDLEQSEFINCNLKNCWFVTANIPRVKGLKTVSPVGHHGRLIYAYVHNGEIRIQAGCRNATPDNMRTAIMSNYDKGAYRSDYLGAIKYLEAWGKSEIKRLKAKAK